MCRCRLMRSCRIINSRSGSVETRGWGFVREAAGAKTHSHCWLPWDQARSQPPAPLQHLFLSCPNTSQLLLFLWPLCPSILLSHHSPPLYIISAAHREPGLSRQTPLSPTALPRLKLKSLSSLLSPTLLPLLAWRDWQLSSLA